LVSADSPASSTAYTISGSSSLVSSASSTAYTISGSSSLVSSIAWSTFGTLFSQFSSYHSSPGKAGVPSGLKNMTSPVDSSVFSFV